MFGAAGAEQTAYSEREDEDSALIAPTRIKDVRSASLESASFMHMTADSSLCSVECVFLLYCCYETRMGALRLAHCMEEVMWCRYSMSAFVSTSAVKLV